MELSVVAEIVPVDVPPERLKATVRPPTRMLFPAASFAWRVRVVLEPEAIVPLARDTTEFASDTAPGVTVRVGKVLVIADPPIVAPRVVAVPERTPVTVAV